MLPIECLYQALSSSFGIIIQVSDFTDAQRKLYAVRKSSGDPDLEILQLRHSPYGNENEMWIVKGKKKHSCDGEKSVTE
jgi:hypothetical protein